MKTKKPVILVLFLILVFISTNSFAAFQDISSNAVYSGAVNRLVNLGIFSGASSTAFRPDDSLTREQFAKIITTASGLGELAGTLSGISSFADVAADSVFNGYINVVLNKGYLGALADGKFHPSEKVTYAQVCTVLVKMLGYTDQDVSGTWPANYIEKAGALGLIKGIDLKSGSEVSRGTIAIMLDRLLDTYIKKSNPADQDKTFITYTGLDKPENFLVYSAPEVVRNFNATTIKIGSIDLTGNMAIIRNTVDNSVSPAVSRIGESIVRAQIKDKDVVYQVTDKRNGKRYVLVVDNKVTGEITSILPDKYTPETLQVDNKNYGISKYMDMSRINGTWGAYNVGDTVTALLGYDGKVADISTTMDANIANFALVLDNYTETSTAIENYGSEEYFVRLLHADGTRKTYKVGTGITGYNGELVKYRIVGNTGNDDYQSVELEKLTYLNRTECTIDKENRKVGYDYVTDNVVIFNLVFKVYGKDSTARLMKWSEMPDGKVSPDKIKYINKVGDFGDINVMLVDNILDEDIALGLVTKIEQKYTKAGTVSMYTVNVAGKEYAVASDVPGISKGSVVKVRMADGSLLSIDNVEKPWVEVNAVEAVDSGRIKVNGVIYPFSSSPAIYFRNYDGNFIRKGINDIVKNSTYGKVAIYLDKNPSYGGKAAMVLVIR